MTEPTEQMGAPGAEHRKLEPFLGTFRAEVKLWMGPGDPVEGPFSSFEGCGFWGFNTTSGNYEGVWVDNASTMIQFETGSVDESGKVWTMNGEMSDPQGEPMTKRSVVTLQDDDHHMMEMFFIKNGQQFKAMEIVYKRA